MVVAYLCVDAAAALDLDDGARRKADTADRCATPDSSSSSRGRDILGIIELGNDIRKEVEEWL